MENHPLKPYRQRVLGTYVLIQAALQALAEDVEALGRAIASDRQRRPETQVLEWRRNDEPDLSRYAEEPCKGIAYKKERNTITGNEQVVWLDRAKDYPSLPVYVGNVKGTEVRVPTAFYLPKHETLVLEHLHAHGIEIGEPQRDNARLTRFKIDKYQFADQPFEGHFRVEAEFSEEGADISLGGYARVSTDQPLGGPGRRTAGPARAGLPFPMGLLQLGLPAHRVLRALCAGAAGRKDAERGSGTQESV
ncbi:hypothetical protein [Microbulbifer litoralis]|uniref:hypothetical protein n=1 Tax=Microbulbifer litoralis TaxID=2933965 RepID=UPI002028F7CF|nr:hypothetical protein [Microbulbifer sp. GX H0434]